MKGLVWIISVIVFAVWSLIAWGAWALVGAAGRVAAQNADVVPGSPELVEWISWLGGTGGEVGGWLVIAIWLLGSIVIFAVTGLVNKLFIRRNQTPHIRG